MPIPNPYKTGEKVLASRAQDGENHEEATVVDVYSLLIGDDEIPMVSVEFPDGQRAWLRALDEDVMPMPEEEGEDAEHGDDAGDGGDEASLGEEDDDG